MTCTSKSLTPTYRRSRRGGLTDNLLLPRHLLSGNLDDVHVVILAGSLADVHLAAISWHGRSCQVHASDTDSTGDGHVVSYLAVVLRRRELPVQHAMA
jgi:hypothetical protein